MSTDLFLKIDGITGESQDSNHKGWINIESFTWGASQPGSMSVGGGGGAGKVQYRDLSVLTHIDKATPAIMRYVSIGKHVNKVELSVCKAGGSQIEYCRITLEDVLITNVVFNGTTNRDLIGLSYQFQASRVKTQYWEQSASGGKGAETQSGWDIKGNKEV
ncbi:MULTISPECIES: type VI secretion system tube protein Hcp [Enterobacteriaceae]|uniref:Hcp family type VI secretion system effector n=1 Tax=Enterobacteriaceae TaxID=543 RepID=UPI00119D9E88|nr:MULTISPECIES: type VI secretion system tube protein Hcp [Enterobacteriaceae]